MASNKALGYALIAIGVLIILFVAFVGYTLYGELISGSLSFPQYGGGAGKVTAANATNSSAVINQVTSSIVSQLMARLPLAMSIYVVLAILALFLVLSAAGRLVVYGIRLLEATSSGENTKGSPKQK